MRMAALFTFQNGVRSTKFEGHAFKRGLFALVFCQPQMRYLMRESPLAKHIRLCGMGDVLNGFLRTHAVSFFIQRR